MWMSVPVHRAALAGCALAFTIVCVCAQQGPPPAKAPPPAEASPNDIDGETLFATVCGWCHENGGRTAGKGPKLAGTTRSDEFILNRTIGTEVWQQLSHHLDRRQIIEFCLLAGQYDALSATMSALQIPLDNPGQAARYK